MEEGKKAKDYLKEIILLLEEREKREQETYDILDNLRDEIWNVFDDSSGDRKKDEDERGYLLDLFSYLESHVYDRSYDSDEIKEELWDRIIR